VERFRAPKSGLPDFGTDPRDVTARRAADHAQVCDDGVIPPDGCSNFQAQTARLQFEKLAAAAE